MLLISEAMLSATMTGLVSAAHSLSDIQGKHYTLRTIEHERLRSAVLAALSIMAGTPVDTAVDNLPRQG